MERLTVLVLTSIMCLSVDRCASILPVRANTNPIALCIRVPSYLRRNTKICSSNYQLMSVIFNGTFVATTECQRQFHMRPWNCSTDRESLPRIIMHAFQETGFLFAIQSAGVAHSIAQACSQGMLDSCRCSFSQGSEQASTKEYTDTTCIDQSISHGIEQSRTLMMNNKERDTRWLLDEHNKEAGRLALIAPEMERKLECRCHGVSGACAVRTCTRPLPAFRQIGNYLMSKYESAVPVTSDNNGKKLIPEKPTVVGPTKYDIVYADQSPEFCEKDLRLGSLGTHSRTCIEGSDGPSGCKVMCCNRGYKRVVQNKTEYCRCIMKYCCEVNCEQCEKEAVTYVCN